MLAEKSPSEVLRGWAKAYREGPAELRFPSDPHAEFFPVDMEVAASHLEQILAENRVLQRRVSSQRHELRYLVDRLAVSEACNRTKTEAIVGARIALIRDEDVAAAGRLLIEATEPPR